jgi:hypothetical protein
MFSDLFRIVPDYGLAVPPEVAAVFRALATLEGTLAQLAPGFNLVAEARARRPLRVPAAPGSSGSPAPPSTAASACTCGRSLRVLVLIFRPDR